jgi:hypothetical protein
MTPDGFPLTIMHVLLAAVGGYCVNVALVMALIRLRCYCSSFPRYLNRACIRAILKYRIVYRQLAARSLLYHFPATATHLR